MSYVNPFTGSLAFYIKDFGQRMVYQARWNTSRRRVYPVNRHMPIRVWKKIMPDYKHAAFIAPNANVIGNVVLGSDVGIMYHVSIRGMAANSPVRVGDGSVIGERSTLMGYPSIGHHSFIDTGCTLDSCEVGNNVYIGPGSAVCIGCVIEDGCILAAGSVLQQDVHIKAREIWAGNPAVKVGDVTQEQAEEADALISHAGELAKQNAEAMRLHFAEMPEIFDYAWFVKSCQQIEARQKQVMPTEGRVIPVEAKRFLQPRVAARMPAYGLRASQPSNRMAPWVRNYQDAWSGNV